jgi:hypothetical protein
MGRLLDEYLAASLPALQAIVADEEPEPTPTLPPGVEGIAPTMELVGERTGQPQPEGATTFPMGAEPPPMQAQAIGPGGAAAGPMATMGGPGAAAPGAPPVPSFDPQTQAPGPTPTMPPAQGADQQDRSGEFEKGPDSFMGLAEKQDPKDIDASIKAMESQGVDIDEQHAVITGTPEYESEDDPSGEKAGKGDPKKMTRQEKGMILMEFGLSLMASSGTGTGTFAGDIGQAGGAALAGHVGRKEAKKKSLIEAEDREQERRLTEAKIKKEERPKTSIQTVGGKYVLINETTKQAEPILMNGEPVDAENVDKYASQVDRDAYEEVVCKGMTGSNMKACKRRALAYAKGGAAKVAFPELEIAEQRENVMDLLQDPDNRSARYPVPSRGGEQIRWKDMKEAEQIEVRDALVEARTRKADITTDGGGAETFGLTDEQVSGMESNTKYQLTNGIWVAKRNGKLVKVDAPKSK